MAESVGQVLREARSSRGIELSDVERVTKIRVKFLRAMEEDDWDALPGPAYARGFLATYASFLDLDGDELVERYKRSVEEAGRAERIPSSVIHPGSISRPRSVRPPALLIAGAVALVALGLVIAVSLGGSDNGGKTGGKKQRSEAGRTGPSTEATTTTSTTTTSEEVSLELRATDLVWVCLVDERDRQLVAGETLSANEVRGPFSAREFALNLGNGSVEMTVDGEAIDVPALAEPIGYRVTPEGVRDLAPSESPTCA
ncbi:MAG TPA: helix-turn-helix domain-containing protein [Solirubrobacterales bacterium]|nr:helix-turn-helix domain-containing protein [Solirubrobacterales bacterium]